MAPSGVSRREFLLAVPVVAAAAGTAALVEPITPSAALARDACVTRLFNHMREARITSRTIEPSDIGMREPERVRARRERDFYRSEVA